MQSQHEDFPPSFVSLGRLFCCNRTAMSGCWNLLLLLWKSCVKELYWWKWTVQSMGIVDYVVVTIYCCFSINNRRRWVLNEASPPHKSARFWLACVNAEIQKISVNACNDFHGMGDVRKAQYFCVNAWTKIKVHECVNGPMFVHFYDHSHSEMLGVFGLFGGS